MYSSFTNRLISLLGTTYNIYLPHAMGFCEGLRDSKTEFKMERTISLFVTTCIWFWRDFVLRLNKAKTAWYCS